MVKALLGVRHAKASKNRFIPGIMLRALRLLLLLLLLVLLCKNENENVKYEKEIKLCDIAQLTCFEFPPLHSRNLADQNFPNHDKNSKTHFPHHQCVTKSTKWVERAKR